MIAPVVMEPPREIRLRRASKTLEVVWADGRRSTLRSFDLRKCCACSSCIMARNQRALQLIDVEVGIEKVELSGVSGVQFHFSDGHARGLFPWHYLHELSELFS